MMIGYGSINYPWLIIGLWSGCWQNIDSVALETM